MIVLSEPTPLPSTFIVGGQPTLPLRLSSPPPFAWDDFQSREEPVPGPSGSITRLRPRTTRKSPLQSIGQTDSEEDSHDEYVQNESAQPKCSPPRARAQSRTPGKRSRSQSVIGVEERGEKVLSCEHPGCGRLFLKPSKLKEHALSHTGERPFKCSHTGCDASYVRSSHLQRHINSHRDPEEKPFECEECHKKFWTKEKLERHVGSHGVSGQVGVISEGGEAKGGKGSRFECPHCPEVFHKHTKLRAHVTELHQDALIRESRSSTPKRVVKKKSKRSASSKGQFGTPDLEGINAGGVGFEIREEEIRFRPFKCEVESCDWSFETAQRLRVHQKVHQGKRYICSDQSHTETLPFFSKWSDLQNHLKVEHPPVCPYQACNGRTFKSKKNLNEHIKVHVDRGDMMYEAKPEERSTSASPARAVSESSDEYRESRGRKRARDEDEDEDEDRIGKRLRRTESDVGKDWMCNEPECDKKFKTKRALTVHHSTAHLGLRPFACPHEQCGNTYGHKHLLQRHIAARHREPSFEEPALPKFLATTTAEEPTGGGLLTGMHALQKMANKALACPCGSTEVDGERCRFRFGRVYDVKRHVRKVHGLELSEGEVRLLLGDAEAGDVQVPI